LSNSRRQRAKELFHRALDRSPEEHDSFLKDACGGDPLLEQEVRSLLAAHREAGGFLQSGPEIPSLEDIDVGGRDPLAGTSVGSYTILGLLGRGGMGAVYRAEQDNPRREVALKLVDRMIVTPELLRRFEVEALVLAKLHHPGIAHVYEAGTTEMDLGSRPYFAMELIDGLPITAYADQRMLDRHERLDLLIKVCEAVQHAHRLGVIHRDLKPANILVDQDGQPKILDFGIARSTDTDLQVTTTIGGQAGLIGTLPYMSPEQVRGDPDELDTRSDVYALGVLCYELLTGKHPRDLKGKPLTDAIRIILEEEPKTLGGMAKARFPADLETIVATALAGEREKRYGSASDLAGDLRRYLDGQPITARPQGAAYQLRKLILRNRLAAALVAGLVLLTLVFAVAMGLQARRTARERDRADQEAEVATEVSSFLESLFLAADPEQSLGETWTARELLDQGAERIEDELLDQPLVRARLLVLMGKAYDSLGHGDSAAPLFQEAVEIGRELDDKNEEPAARKHLDEGLRMLARQLARQDRHDEAIALCREALALSEATWGIESRQYGTGLNSLAYHLDIGGHPDEARELILRGLDLRERMLGPDHLDVGWSRYQLAWFLVSAHEYEDANEQFARACEIWEKTYPENHPQFATCLFGWARVLVQLGEYDAARVHHEKALAIRRTSLGPDHRAVADSLNDLGYLMWKWGRLEEASHYYAEAIATYKRATGPASADVMRGLSSLAGVAEAANEPARAEAALQERVDLAREHYADKPEVVSRAQELLAEFRARRSGDPAAGPAGGKADPTARSLIAP
jgi:tetratricopeptide (TPR) repeat protein